MLSATEDIFDWNVFKHFDWGFVERLTGFETELSKLVGPKREYLLFGWMMI